MLSALAASVHLLATGKTVGEMDISLGSWSGGGLVAGVIVVVVISAFRRRQ